jgi:hypothetical protein
MNSFLYLFSKFTEEFLLLTAAGVFGLLSVYCYEWVIKKRRLGAARDQIPASMVKAYLNQLIAEAQSVRVQLFGLIQTNPEEAAGLENADKLLSTFATAASSGLALSGAPAPGIPGDLTERLRALQAQLADKESLVVNINIEKSKLLEELDSLRRNQQNATLASPGAPASEELARKVKDLESRLEEYSLFEDDLANLKRLQQENIALKKKLEEMGGTLVPGTPAAPEEKRIIPGDAAEAPAETAIAKGKGGVSQDDIEALLEGKPATPPLGASEPEARIAPPASTSPAPALAIAPEPDSAPVAAAPPAPAIPDAFENLVSSVDKSLDPPVASAPAPVAAPATEPKDPPSAAPAPNLAAKTDDELLKEFENLLNS